MTKADFVRSMPEASAAEIIDAAKVAGLNVTRGDVSWARSVDRKKKKKRERTQRAPAKKKTKKTSAQPKRRKVARAKNLDQAGELETQFRRIVMRIGLERARGLIDQLDDAAGEFV